MSPTRGEYILTSTRFCIFDGAFCEGWLYCLYVCSVKVTTSGVQDNVLIANVKEEANKSQCYSHWFKQV